MKIQSLTRRPKAKKDDAGRWANNGAKAKSGLAKSILGSAWGQTKIYLGYKARRAGKLCIEVPAFYSFRVGIRVSIIRERRRNERCWIGFIWERLLVAGFLRLQWISI